MPFNLQPTLNQVLGILEQFAINSNYLRKIELVFGEKKAAQMSPRELLSALNTLPVIEIRTSKELKGAFGAFSAPTGKIYLSEGILGDQNLIIRVLLEEIGHYLGGEDTERDEGELFSNIVREIHLSESELTRIQTENDITYITLNGQKIQIEQANFTGTHSNMIR